jgi:hypothetical protein
MYEDAVCVPSPHGRFTAVPACNYDEVLLLCGARHSMSIQDERNVTVAQRPLRSDLHYCMSIELISMRSCQIRLTSVTVVIAVFN